VVVGAASEADAGAAEVVVGAAEVVVGAAEVVAGALVVALADVDGVVVSEVVASPASAAGTGGVSTVSIM
jgi:hypothetical protein